MLYIIRHGKTDWNMQNKLQGHMDIPLNEEGIQMAIESGKKNKDVHFDICFCSPLTRAKQTAAYFLGDRKVPVIYDDRLKEMNFGIYEGTLNYRTDENCPVNVFFKDPANYNGVKDGESTKDLMNRTKDFLDTVVNPMLKEGKDILIVGHGAANSSLICQFRGLGVEKFWDEGIENCRLIKLC